MSGALSLRASQAAPIPLNLAFEVQPDEVLAVFGVSGSGKSTLVNLLPRFFKPSSGQILLDGIDIQALDLRDLRAQMAFVSQDVILFNDTIAANVAYGAVHQEESLLRHDGAGALAVGHVAETQLVVTQADQALVLQLGMHLLAKSAIDHGVGQGAQVVSHLLDAQAAFQITRQGEEQLGMVGAAQQIEQRLFVVFVGVGVIGNLNGIFLFGLDAHTGAIRWEQPRVNKNVAGLLSAKLSEDATKQAKFIRSRMPDNTMVN